MGKLNLPLLAKRAAIIAVIFIGVGYALDVTVNGFSPSEAAERLLKHGLWQSLAYATLIAVIITPFRSGS